MSRFRIVLSALAALLALILALGPCSIIPESPDIWVHREIGDFEDALYQFQKAFTAPYVPSRIKLSETCNYPERDRPGTLDVDSVRFLGQLWPRLNLAPGTQIDWNGNGQIGGNWILEGDECLVFFLGGIPGMDGDKPTCLGFSLDPRNPASPGGPRCGPFYEFNSHRLQDLHGRGFLSFLDRYGRGQPYAFFSSYGEENGYNRYGSTDCPSLRVWPYAAALLPKPRFVNPRRYQILSAGEDGQFGPGSDGPAHVWTPAEADRVPQPGRDDLSNFYRGRLGVPGLD